MSPTQWECSAESVKRGGAVHPLASLQMEYSLFSRDGLCTSLRPV